MPILGFRVHQIPPEQAVTDALPPVTACSTPSPIATRSPAATPSRTAASPGEELFAPPSCGRGRREAGGRESVRADRMAENIDVLDFALADDEMAHIAAMDTCASLFVDDRDPAVVGRLGSFRR
jgi:hypothetical protein